MSGRPWRIRLAVDEVSVEGPPFSTSFPNASVASEGRGEWIIDPRVMYTVTLTAGFARNSANSSSNHS